jgi:hypothetical protein
LDWWGFGDVAGLENYLVAPGPLGFARLPSSISFNNNLTLLQKPSIHRSTASPSIGIAFVAKQSTPLATSSDIIPPR